MNRIKEDNENLEFKDIISHNKPNKTNQINQINQYNAKNKVRLILGSITYEHGVYKGYYYKANLPFRDNGLNVRFNFIHIY